MISRRYDFRGGYQSNAPPELTAEDMVKTGQNIYWQGKIKKRPGWDNLSTDSTINNNTVRGFTRAYMNGGWVNIVAIDDASDVNFYYGTTGSYTAIDNSFDWTTGVNVELRWFADDIVVAVNGTDKPAIIYYDSGYAVENLEAYDERTRTNDEWYAGQWDDSETPEFVDDTSDAQSTTVDDFQISSGTNNDGFYIAGVFTFNKVIIKNCPDLGTTIVAEYAYYAGSGTWTTFSPTTEPDWVATEGDKTLEFDLPFASDGTLLWKTFGDLTTQQDPTGATGGALQRYIIRIRFTTADTAGSADYLIVSNTQYLSQLFANDKPQAIEVHKNRLFLAAGNAFRFSPPNQVTEWNDDEIEYCGDGGRLIRKMVSADTYLAIFKDSYVYRYYGTTTENSVLRSYPQEGITSKRGAAYVNNVVVYTADDGIRVLAGEESVLVSRHIQSDYDGWTLSDTVVANFNGDAVISFPTNDIILWADTDFVRSDPLNAGDATMSFWKWAGLAADEIIYADGAGDSEILILNDPDNNRLVKSTTNAYDTAFDTTQTNIECTLETSFESEGVPNQKKLYKRVKLDMSKSGNWTLTITGDNGDATATATISSGTGSSHYYADIAIPYTLDGQNISYKLVNQTANAVEFFGSSTEFERRAF